MMKIVIDHDEAQCQELFNGTECYYIIAVWNNNGNSSLRYKIEVSHNQNNHILLQERTPKIDSVDLEGYKYYKFTIPTQD